MGQKIHQEPITSAEDTSNPPSSEGPPSLDTAATETTTPAASEGAAAAADAVVASGGTAEEAAAAAAAYTPDYKFKYRDPESLDEKKQIEAEIPEFLRASIKDAETEKKVKEIFERSYGLDFSKNRSKAYQEQLSTMHQEIQERDQGFQQLGNLLQKGRFDEFFELTKVPQQKIFEWVINKSRYNAMSAEERAQVDRQRETERRAELFEHESTASMDLAMSNAQKLRTLELKSSLNEPDVKSFASSFDERVGTPGSFADEVIQYGRAVWATRKIDLPVEAAVKGVMQKYGRFISQPAPGVTGVPAAGGAGAPAVQADAGAKRTVPVIPKIQGGTTSPAKTVRSFEDLKKLSQEASARLSASAP